MNDRVIVAVKYTPVAARGGLRKSVGAFLRYVQYRDRHADPQSTAQPTAKTQRRVDGEIRYIAHRDRAANGARLFDAVGTAGDEQRRALASFVTRAAAATRPRLITDEGGELGDRRRAVYRFVISPENAAGLDLRQLTLAAVRRLEADAGGEVRWIAAEHRNTQHPHVHLIVAGFREPEPDCFRSLVLTRPRLQHIKDAVSLEIQRERGHDPLALPRRELPGPPEAGPAAVPISAAALPSQNGLKEALAHARPPRGVGRPTVAPGAPQRVDRHRPLLFPLRGSALLRMAARYQWEAEREAAGHRAAHEMEVA